MLFAKRRMNSRSGRICEVSHFVYEGLFTFLQIHSINVYLELNNNKEQTELEPCITFIRFSEIERNLFYFWLIYFSNLFLYCYTASNSVHPHFVVISFRMNMIEFTCNKDFKPFFYTVISIFDTLRL